MLPGLLSRPRIDRIAGVLAGWTPPSLAARADRAMRATVDSFADGRYEESNRRTSAPTGLDLSELGHAL